MDLKTLQKICHSFLGELINSQRGQKTSLPFIIHQIPPFSLVENGKIFQVLVIGGSICKKALVLKQKNHIKIIKKSEKLQPIFKTKKDLLEFIEKQLEDNIEILALNFTHPLKPVFEKGKLDGILISGAKEHKFEGLVGKKVGAEIEKYIFKKNARQIKVSVANDTVCLLLSGLTKHSYDQIVAGVVGTGLNFAIFLNENKLVNLESANFDKFPISPEAKEIDSQSAHPGRGLFEKETAGAYLYRHFNLILDKLEINFPKVKSTSYLKEIADQKIPKVSKIAQDLLEKSAALVACQIGGITLFIKQTQSSSSNRAWTNATSPVWNNSLIFIMEGSLFWGSLKTKVEKYLKKLVPDYNIKFVKIENSEILGAAKLIS